MSALDASLTWWWGRADDGTVVELGFPPAEEEQAHDRWPPIGLEHIVRPSHSPSRRLVVTRSGDVLVDGEPSFGRWERIESELALFASEKLAGLVAVHAGVILNNGKALVVPGSSGAGKSTLCIAALEAGASVLTDEYALVRPETGEVTGWRRPLRVRRPGGVDRLDLAVDSDPLPVGVVALLTYEPSAPPAWAPAGQVDAVLGLMANTVCARSRPDEALDAALAIARSAQAVSGTRGEASVTIRELLTLLA